MNALCIFYVAVSNTEGGEMIYQLFPTLVTMGEDMIDDLYDDFYGYLCPHIARLFLN